MLKLRENWKEIKESNLVFFVEKSTDLKLLSKLKLEEKILLKIKKTIRENKDKVLDFFYGTNTFDKIYIIYSKKEKPKEVNYFLGNVFRKLPKNLTILPNNIDNIPMLLNYIILGRYKYQEYKTKKEEDKIYFIVDEKGEKIAKQRLKTIDNIVLARDLGERPANSLYPKTFAKLVKETEFKNTKVKVYDDKEIEKLGLNLLANVGKGSSKKPYMVILERVMNKNLPTIGIVGKGITFDTGGIQVKPGSYMYDMKGDMGGAATAFAIMKELDTKKLNVNIVACLVLAENHISENSYKPSDIIKSYSGKTVDIVHTDGEGRLIMADGVSYISDKYKLDKIITIATLTGACQYALGYRYAGIMGNDEEIIKNLLKYSKTNQEKYWRMPFDNYYVEKTKGETADLENINDKVHAGATMGAAFLYNFLLNNEKFTHIDIAGAGINDYEPFGYTNKGMTGFGIDSLSYLLENL